MKKKVGRPVGITKIRKTYTIDIEIAEKKPKSCLINNLLKEHYEDVPRTF